MLFIDTELVYNTKKNEKRRRLDCFVNETEEEKKQTFSKKKNEIDDF